MLCFLLFLYHNLLDFAALLVGRSRDRFPVVSLGIFSVVPPTEPCALRSNQPLKVSTRDFSWGKGGRCVWLTTYHPCSAEMSRKSGALTYQKTLGSPRPVAEQLYFYLLHSLLDLNGLTIKWCLLNDARHFTPIENNQQFFYLFNPLAPEFPFKF